MSATRISQRDARRLRARVRQLEDQIGCLLRRATMESAWMGGDYIADEPNTTERARVAIETARRLGHAVFCEVQNDRIRFFAVVVPS